MSLKTSQYIIANVIISGILAVSAWACLSVGGPFFIIGALLALPGFVPFFFLGGRGGMYFLEGAPVDLFLVNFVFYAALTALMQWRLSKRRTRELNRRESKPLKKGGVAAEIA